VYERLLGRPRKGVELSEGLVEKARGFFDITSLSGLTMHRGAALAEIGQIEDSISLIRSVVDICEKFGVPVWIGPLYNCLGYCYGEIYQIERAWKFNLKSEEIARNLLEKYPMGRRQWAHALAQAETSIVENLLDHEFLGQHIRDARFKQLLPQKVSEEEAKIFKALTYGSIAMIDEGVGKILRRLEKYGLASNTMVIFTSDHGDLCGDHGLILKGPAHYRSVINIPLIWRIPELTKKSISESLVSTVDLPKTILNILGIREKYHPNTMQGKDITPIIKNPDEKIRHRLLIEHDEEISPDKVMRLRTLITKNHRLTIYDGFHHFGDLFDYRNDPDEIDNLWKKDKELKNTLIEKLLREIISIRPRYPKRCGYN